MGRGGLDTGKEKMWKEEFSVLIVLPLLLLGSIPLCECITAGLFIHPLMGT